MNGNITEDGIRKDLEWMHRIGLGGFHQFDAGTSQTPVMVAHRLSYMHPEWQHAFRYAMGLADSLDMEVTIASAPGWSATGGPWVSEADAMKKLVWRQTVVNGGRKIDLQLPSAYTMAGPYQNMPLGDDLYGTDWKPLSFYRNINVLAVRMPDEECSLADLHPTLTSSSGTFTLQQLTDGDAVTSRPLSNGPDGYCWLQYAFPQPVTIRGMRLAIVSLSSTLFGNIAGHCVLEASNDGKNFHEVQQLGLYVGVMQTRSLPATTARYFRLKIDNPKAFGFLWGTSQSAPQATQVAEFDLSTCSVVNQSEYKAGYSTLAGAPSMSSLAERFASTADVIDITSHVDSLGHLVWDAPAGRWRIFRFGYSLTGKKNHPAPADATGLEVDKLDPTAFRNYITHYLDMMHQASGDAMGKTIRYMLTDSYEAGMQNWTPLMAVAFRQRNGYELYPWMPVLTGMVIDSPEASDAFLRDWRATIGSLITANYDQLTTLTQQYGLKGRYSESHESGRAYLADGMDVKRTSQIPMSAMWMPGSKQGDAFHFLSDDRESSSVAHIYGQNIAAAESFTDLGHGYGFTPKDLKWTADRMMKQGINRFVIHESAHQPLDSLQPGFSLMMTGQWFNRHDTWAEMAAPWISYLSRSSYMLQQGQNVADILVYYGEDNNITNLYANKLPAVPAGYEYDFISANGLANDIKAVDSDLVAPSGARYHLLWLDKNMTYMSIPVLRKIHQLVLAGVPIAGYEPKQPYGLGDDPQEFQRLVDDVWHKGRSNVSTTHSLSEAIRSADLQPDFISSDSTVTFRHRRLPQGGNIYWLSKTAGEAQTVTVSMKMSGRLPLCFNPETGAVDPVSYTMSDNRTMVTMRMKKDDACFIVATEPTSEDVYERPATQEQEVLRLSTPWKVAFQEHRGAPATTTIDSLVSLSSLEEPGIKYFSGIATYSNSFRWKHSNMKHLWLDLGDVADMAEVWLNGQCLGIVWRSPYRIDISTALRKGDNRLEVKVANRWVNRLIGDVQPDCAHPIAWVDASEPYYKADGPLLPSGLLGPVRILQVKELPLSKK